MGFQMNRLLGFTLNPNEDLYEETIMRRCPRKEVLWGPGRVQGLGFRLLRRKRK